MIESGDAAGAVATLQKVGDIDSKPDGLRDLLKAYLQTGQLSEAGTIANKLLTVHNDLTAISSFADALMQAGQYENCSAGLRPARRATAGGELRQGARQPAHDHRPRARQSRLPAEAARPVQQGRRDHARQRSHANCWLMPASSPAICLAPATFTRSWRTIEPQNPLHMQNYQQVVSQLGGTSGEQADHAGRSRRPASTIWKRPRPRFTSIIPTRSRLRSARLSPTPNSSSLTTCPPRPLDRWSELCRWRPTICASTSASPPCTRAPAASPKPPLCCRTLQSVYSEAEYPEEASRYGELAERYEERSSAPAPDVPGEEAQFSWMRKPRLQNPKAPSKSSPSTSPR